MEGYLTLITPELCATLGKHKVVNTCQCGQNRICRNCGYGQGTYPCDCQREGIMKLIEESLERHSKAWEALVKY